MDGTYYDSYDSKYVIGAIRDAFSRSGALLAKDEGSSDIVVEARSGALSIDSNSSLVGIPQSGVPTPLAGTVQIPELAIYKSTSQYSMSKLALLAYATDSREHFFSSGPLTGRSYNKFYKFLGLIQWTSTDIPEKKKHREKAH